VRSIGTLRYSPKLLGNNSEKFWLVVDCDPTIGLYYRNLYQLFHHKTRQLMRPAWESHITVIRNEEPPRKELWEKYSGKQVEFEYEHFVHTDGNYWWVRVLSEELLDIRTELEIDRNPYFPLHLSIGHET
jgi:hypothetical protein